MMNASCGDLGLRIALCDLIERLKRCEQKCGYLEECRHELIKEVMRLRTQNNSLIVANSAAAVAPIANASNPNVCRVGHQLIAELPTHLPLNQTINCIHNRNNDNNNVMIGLVNGLQAIGTNKDVNKNSDFNDLIGSDGDNRDESWQQITVRLLQEMRRDIAAKGLSGQPIVNGVNGVTTYDGLDVDDLIDTNISNDMQSNSNANNDTIITMNDSLSHMNNNLVESKAYSTTGRQKQAMAVNEMTNEDILSPFNEFSIKSPYLLGISDHKLKNRTKILSNNREESGSEQAENSESKLSANYSALLDANSQTDDNSEAIQAFGSAMSCVKQDLNEVLQALTTQNEKLTRLKAKQLRHFFNRQINLDHNVSQTNTTSSAKRQQTAHQN